MRFPSAPQTAYPSWNPFIKEISGDAKVGGRLRARIAPPGQAGMVFKPVVLACAQPRHFLWRGSFLGARHAASRGRQCAQSHRSAMSGAPRAERAAPAPPAAQAWCTATTTSSWSPPATPPAGARAATRLICAKCVLTRAHAVLCPTRRRRRLVHTEEFSGCLGGLFGRMFEANSTKGFVLMNEALKARAEAA